jgi:hypothetical protein
MLIVIQVVGSLLTIIAAGFAASWGAYAKKKGENLATKEDFNDLKNQTAELTKTTKEIETKIDDQVWNRQRQWEMKRDIILDALRSASNFDNAQLTLLATFRAAKKCSPEQVDLWIKPKSDALEAWNKAQSSFEATRMLTAVVVGRDVRDSFDAMSRTFRDAYPVLKKGEDNETTKQAETKITNAISLTLMMLRRELGVVEIPSMLTTSQSSESSAAPTPD